MAIDYQPLNLKQAEFVSAKDILSDSRKIRDDKRKYAIESAMREGMKEDGSVDPTTMRKSLISQGFGEDADAVVSNVMGQRQKDVGGTVELGYRIKMLVDNGIISPEVANQLFNNTQIVTKTPTEQSTDMSWSQGVPTTAQTQTNDSSVDGTINITGSTMPAPAATYDYSTSNKKAQATPEYSADLFKFERKDGEGVLGAPGTGEGSTAPWQLPSDETLKGSTLLAANALGYDLKKDGVDLNTQALSRAEAAVPRVAPFIPPTNMTDYAKTVTEYNQKMNDRQAKVQELALTNLAKVEELGRSYRDQGRSDVNLGLSQNADTRSAQSEARNVAEEARLQSEIKEIAAPGTTGPSKASLPRAQTKYYGSLAMTQAYDDIVKNGRKTSDGTGAYVTFGQLSNWAASTLKGDEQPITVDALVAKMNSTGAFPGLEELKEQALLRNPDLKNLIGDQAVKAFNEFWSGSGRGPKISQKPIKFNQLERELKEMEEKLKAMNTKMPAWKPVTAAGALTRGVSSGNTPSEPANSRGSKKGR